MDNSFFGEFIIHFYHFIVNYKKIATSLVFLSIDKLSIYNRLDR